jgi:glyoxylase I family protein
MSMQLDHVVIWVDDPLRSLDFYEKIVGLPGVRGEEFRTGNAPFPSVRVSAGSIIDLMDRTEAAAVDVTANAAGSAGHPVNHFCIAMSRHTFDALIRRLAVAGVEMSKTMKNLYGAQGRAPDSFYFQDPDSNVVEARCYA